MIYLLLKFICILVIPIGYLLTFEATIQFPFSYHLLILLSTLISIVFITIIRQHRPVTVVGYIFFITYLIGYFIQFFIIMNLFSTNQINTTEILMGYDFANKIFTEYSIFDFYTAFEAMSIFYFCILFTLILLSFTPLNTKFQFQTNYQISLKTIQFQAKLLFTLGIFILSLVFLLHLGHPNATTLPLGLAGLILLSAKYIIPFGLLSMVWLSESTKQTSNANTIYFLYTVLLYLATLSKFVLISSFVYLFIIWLLAGTLTPVRRKKILFALLFFIISYPLINIFRSIMLVPEHLATAIIQEVSWSTINIYHTFGTIVFRFSGYSNLLLFIHDIDVFDLYRVFDILSGPLALNDYAGQRWITNSTGMAASFFGGLYFLYENVGIAFFMTFLFILLIILLLNTLQVSYLKLKPVIYLLFMAQTVFIFVDGLSLLSLILFLVPFIISIIFFEFLIRKKHV